MKTLYLSLTIALIVISFSLFKLGSTTCYKLIQPTYAEGSDCKANWCENQTVALTQWTCCKSTTTEAGKVNCHEAWVYNAPYDNYTNCYCTTNQCSLWPGHNVCQKGIYLGSTDPLYTGFSERDAIGGSPC